MSPFKLDKHAARTATLLVGGIYGGLALLFALAWTWDSLMRRYPLIMVPVTLATCAVLVFVGCWVVVYRDEVRQRTKEEGDAASAPR